MTRIVNLTPHEVVVIDDQDRPVATFPPSGQVARVAERVIATDTLVLDEGTIIPVVTVAFGDVTGLPEEWHDVDDDDPLLAIVSRLVYDQYRVLYGDTDGLLVPDDPVRDDAGRIVGCRRFAS